MRGSTRLSAFGLALCLLLPSGCEEPPDPLERASVLQDEHLQPGPIEALRKLVEERPEDPEVQYRYGLALLLSRQPTLALWPLERAADSPEWEERATVALASAHLQAGAYDRSIDLIGRAIEDSPDEVAYLLLRANAYLLTRRHYEEALADTERVLEIDPDNPHALGPRAMALLHLERLDEAGEALEQLEARHRDDLTGLHGSSAGCTARAKFAEEKGELEAAEERYEVCLEHFPGDPNLVQQATGFYDQLGRSERSLEILRSARETAPEARGFRLLLAQRLRALDREDEALELLRESTEHPDPRVAAEAWAELARFHTDSGDYDEAIEAYGEVRRLAGPDDVLLLLTADALVITGRHQEALALADQIGVAPYKRILEGRVALAQGRPARALEHFEEGIRLWPDNAVARYYAAVAAEQVGDFTRAIEDYRNAMRIDALATDAHLRVARLQEAAGQLEPALSALRFRPGGRPGEREAKLLELRIVGRLGRADQVLPVLGRSLVETQLYGQAVAALAQGVRAHGGAGQAVKTIRSAEGLDLRDPAQAEALEALVDLLAEEGKAAEALAEVDRSLRAQPEAAAFHALRGRALAALGRRDEARSAWERAVAEDPAPRVALLGLAGLQLEAGDAAAARPLYERALERDPDDSAAARGLAAALVALDSTEEAERRLEVLLREHPYDSDAALALAELRLARGAEDPRTHALARRAVFFGGGEAARDVMERTKPASESGGSAPEAG